MGKDIRIEFAYLDTIRKTIESYTNDLLYLRDNYDVVVDEEKALNLIEALEYLKTAIETTPIA